MTFCFLYGESKTARKFLIQQMFAVPQVGIRLYVKLKQADVIWCPQKKELDRCDSVCSWSPKMVHVVCFFPNV